MSDLQSYTFWQLATQYKIEIPIIQRDYAQGRLEAEASEIREKFLKDLLEILESPNQTLNLDFVYGTIDNDIFIPIDGQQRLTTLYLLHWYLAIRFNQNFKVIKGLSYKTRISSRDFCSELTKSTFEIDILEQQYCSLRNDPKNKIFAPFLSSTIKNSSWYYLSWNSDPTIQSMLNTLDSIHVVFKNVKNDVWSKLIEPIAIENNLIMSDINKAPVLSFKFLNLKDFKLSEELYLKMNGRGKPLSEFEKFKTLIIGHISDLKWTNFNIANIDNKWTDLLWLNRIQENKTIDDVGINLIKNIAFINYFKNHLDFKGADKNDEKDYEEAYSLFLNKPENITFLKKDFKLCFNHLNDYNFLYSTFDVLIKNSKHIEFELKKQLWEGQNDILRKSFFEKSDFSNRTYLYAIVQYYSNNLDLENFEEWFRVLRNLIENTNINSSNFTNILNSIELLSTNTKSLKDISLKPNEFSSQQVKEEIIKLSLIELDINWKEAIKNAENHPLFKGNIGFLLPDKDKSDLQIFIKRSMIAMSLFDAKCAIQDSDDFLTIRGIFCFCEEINLPITVLNNKVSWKKLLQNMNIQNGFIKMIDEINDDYKGKINKKIAGFDDQSTFWKYYLIKNPDLIKHVDAAKIQAFPNHLTENPFIFLCNSPERLSELSISISNNRNELVSHLITIYKFKFIKGDSHQIENKYFKGWNLRITKEIENSTDNNQITLLLEQERAIIETKHFSDIKEYTFKNGYDNLLIELKKDHPEYFSIKSQ